ncbi:hypothetical protein [Hymenobacter lucidus]|uniref:DUF4136 domain-containing protein n=1 Tax=Hymenobacter lucidus TaxID=2880930 RepID=A0ABS8AX11_9BACT|nr:hypothetical protein [Hymenobacter lucidus]MCB2410349.1 hypothetical protein [Hymenobacter lucidus]
MFVFLRAAQLGQAAVLAAALLSSCGRPARSLSQPASGRVAPPVLVVPPPALTVIMTRADGSGGVADKALVAAETNQIYNNMQAWLLQHARPFQLRMPVEAAGPAATDAAATVRTLAAQHQADQVLLTQVYHQRVYAPVPLAVSPATVVTQTTEAGNVTTSATAASTGPAFREEISVDLTLYQADGTIMWKHNQRGTPNSLYPTAGYVADWLVNRALDNMPRSGR